MERNMRQAGEPSVEEILASIKKVIARDSRVDAGRADAARRDDARPNNVRSDAAARARAGDVLDLGDSAAEMLGDDRTPPAQAAPGQRHAEPDDDDGDQGESPLLNEATATAMRDSLAALAMLSQPGARPQIVRSGETSLEGLARDLLRPMLAEWLDQNLPGMVERMVAAEIARILHKKA
jgi:cell pole-organizing protein PopZ